MNPVTRILRTLAQVLAAGVLIVPVLVAFLATVGVAVDGKAWAAVLAAAVILVTTVQNALEQAGIIPTLGANRG